MRRSLSQILTDDAVGESEPQDVVELVYGQREQYMVPTRSGGGACAPLYVLEKDRVVGARVRTEQGAWDMSALIAGTSHAEKGISVYQVPLTSQPFRLFLMFPSMPVDIDPIEFATRCRNAILEFFDAEDACRVIILKEGSGGDHSGKGCTVIFPDIFVDEKTALQVTSFAIASLSEQDEKINRREYRWRDLGPKSAFFRKGGKIQVPYTATYTACPRCENKAASRRSCPTCSSRGIVRCSDKDVKIFDYLHFEEESGVGASVLEADTDINSQQILDCFLNPEWILDLERVRFVVPEGLPFYETGDVTQKKPRGIHTIRKAKRNIEPSEEQVDAIEECIRGHDAKYSKLTVPNWAITKKANEWIAFPQGRQMRYCTLCRTEHEDAECEFHFLSNGFYLACSHVRGAPRMLPMLRSTKQVLHPGSALKRGSDGKLNGACYDLTSFVGEVCYMRANDEAYVRKRSVFGFPKPKQKKK